MERRRIIRIATVSMLLLFILGVGYFSINKFGQYWCLSRYNLRSDTVSTTVIVGSPEPQITTVVLNNGSDIDLTDEAATNVAIIGTINNTNGCSHIVSVTAVLFRSGVGESCLSNENNCIQVSSSDCSVVSSGNICSGLGDISADYICNATVYYNADPTDSGIYAGESWSAKMIAANENATGSSVSISGVEMKSLLALTIDPSVISYGTVGIGSHSSTLDQNLAIENTGNVSIDTELYGSNMAQVGGSGSINAGEQKYSLDVTTFSDGIALKNQANEDVLETDISKTTNYLVPESHPIYWGINIPVDTPAGTYSGTTVFTAIINS